MTEVQKKTLGLAVASLVFGCLILIPLLGILFSLTAIVLGIVALVKISNNKENLKGKGLAISGISLGAIGIVIIPVILGLLAAIAIPNLLRARIAANEASAVAALKTVSIASKSYRAANNRYPDQISDLAYAEPPYIGENLASGTMQGYIFKCIGASGGSVFLVTAIPETKGITGSSSFCATEDEIVRYDPDGNSISTLYSCQVLKPYISRYDSDD